MVQSRPILIHNCPSDSTLKRFNDGRIEDNIEIDRISSHLGDCEYCIDKLELMVPGAIAEGLREGASSALNLDDTISGSQAQDLASLSDNLDQIISQAQNTRQDRQLDPAELGENRYEVIASAGEGKFSSVFGALTNDTVGKMQPHHFRGAPTTLFGLKIPHARKLTTRRHSQQFFNDCQKANKLDHPGIQPVFEYGLWDDHQFYLSKPFIQHPTLARFARNVPFISIEMMWSMFRQIVDAVHYAHEQQVLHRHLTPNNIHVIPVEPTSTSESGLGIHLVVSDFGFVLDSRYHFDLIEPQDSRNPFFSPESAALNSDFVDVRSDIYSMGKILKLLYRLTGESDQQPAVKRIIEKSTAMRRRDRYQTVSELKDALVLI